jgi:hypothetical protein
MATGLIIGGGLLIGAAGNYLAARSQAGAARDAARAARESGQQASDIIGRSYQGAYDELRGGAEAQGRYLGQAGNLIGRQANDIGALANQFDQRYEPQRQVGNEAIAQLRAALLGGDTSGFTQSPGYQFRMQEGQKAIERAAAASGNFGSGANIKDLTRFGQGVASQEYGDYLSRLLGLQQIGSQATAQSAQTAMGLQGLRSSLLGQQAGYIGQRGAVEGALGNNLAALRTGIASNQAAALTGSQQQATKYDLAAGNAMAQGYSNLANTAQQGAMLYALYNMPRTTKNPLTKDRGIQTGTPTEAPQGYGAPMQTGAPIPYTSQFPYGSLA